MSNQKKVVEKELSKVALIFIGFSIAFLWASAFVGIRYALHGYHPGSMALLRYLVASVFLAFVYLVMPRKVIPKKKDIPLIFLSGVFGIGFYNIALNYGEQQVSAAIASFTISQVPVLLAIIAFIFLGEKATLLKLLGVAVSFLGLLLIAFSQQAHIVHGPIWSSGLFYVVLAVLCATLYCVLQKPVLKYIPAYQYVCYAIWAGTIPLLVYLPDLWQDLHYASLGETMTVIYMGIFPAALSYFLWSYLLSKVTMTQSTAVLYSIPFITLLLSWVFLDELIHPLALLGGVIALAGAYCVSRRASSHE